MVKTLLKVTQLWSGGLGYKHTSLWLEIKPSKEEYASNMMTVPTVNFLACDVVLESCDRLQVGEIG